MKKIRLGALLAALTLITSCLVGASLAKYTTSTSDNVTARVAHWGFDDPGTIEFDNLFSSAYLKADDENANSVQSDNQDLVVAPGTSGEVKFRFDYDGDLPEVAYKFSCSVIASYANDYYPEGLIWYLDGERCGSIRDLSSAATAKFGNGRNPKEYGPGELPETFYEADGTPIEHTISWEWPYEGDDVEDTEDGNSFPRSSVPVIGLRIIIRAAQID